MEKPRRGGKIQAEEGGFIAYLVIPDPCLHSPGEGNLKEERKRRDETESFYPQGN